MPMVRIVSSLLLTRGQLQGVIPDYNMHLLMLLQWSLLCPHLKPVRTHAPNSHGETPSTLIPPIRLKERSYTKTAHDVV